MKSPISAKEFKVGEQVLAPLGLHNRPYLDSGVIVGRSEDYRVVIKCDFDSVHRMFWPGQILHK